MKIAKYFWDLKEEALKETEKILKNPEHPRFAQRMVAFLSRCDKPKEVFAIIPREEFVKIWPRVRIYWVKLMRRSEFRDWWETIYEQLVPDSQQKIRKAKGKSPALFQKIGQTFKKARIEKGLSQKQLALAIGMKQPDISSVEEGKKNITLATLMRFCKILEIKSIDMAWGPITPHKNA